MAFVSYGGAAGGIRAVEQLRQVVIELSMVPVRRHIAVPGIFRRIDQERQLVDPPVDDAQAMLDDLVWWAGALAQARADDNGRAVLTS